MKKLIKDLIDYLMKYKTITKTIIVSFILSLSCGVLLCTHGKDLLITEEKKITILDKYRDGGDYWLVFEIVGEEERYGTNNRIIVNVKEFKKVSENETITMPVPKYTYKWAGWILFYFIFGVTGIVTFIVTSIQLLIDFIKQRRNCSIR